MDGGNVPAGFVTASGAVVFDSPSGSSPSLRVPFVAVVRGNSAMSTTPRSANVVGAGPVALTTTNAAGASGTVDSYACSLSDPRDATFTDVNAVGVQAFPDSDLGVFAISTNTRNANPSVNEWDVLVDTKGDGVADYNVIGFDGSLFASAFNGTLLSSIFDAATGDLVDLWFAGGGLDSSVVLLPFTLSTVGVDSSNPEFSSRACSPGKVLPMTSCMESAISTPSISRSRRVRLPRLTQVGLPPGPQLSTPRHSDRHRCEARCSCTPRTPTERKLSSFE
jgi:hypothetical protein